MSNVALPLVLAGPILRRITAQRLTLWLATSENVAIELTLSPAQQPDLQFSQAQLQSATQTLMAGKHLVFHLIDLPLETALPEQQWIGYQLDLIPQQGAQAGQRLGWQTWAPQLCYPQQSRPGFIIKPQVEHLLHGSCRKPHHPSDDGLVVADQLLSQAVPEQWPSLLMMSGDQIYADDVATPMLVACHQLIKRLELFNEPFTDAAIDDAAQLHGSQAHYLTRELLLPDCHDEQAQDAIKALFKGVKKPIFTSDTAHNHLISLAEVLAMYLLVWSPAPWQLVSVSPPEALTPEQQGVFAQEAKTIARFSEGLAQVQRVMAHLPCAMIFDDHDVTDDWNLSAAWEQAAYGHPFSKRILGNALVGYLLCQGWGNGPEHFSTALMGQLALGLQQPGTQPHNELIQQLIDFDHWHYQWPTTPALVVLDTRTHRWRSERNLNAPSGLMDWEALTDLQQTLLGKEAVILVSPAPMFGVKLIEVIQQLFTWAGHPLMVDAENWMAHRGAANVLLNLFRHSKTPQHFIILSGDVHYSFAYQVQLRGRQGGPDIWQITSSGIKNEFPARLLSVLDRLNRWLYAPYSPLNWFTKRRRMKVIPHRPDLGGKGERLVNASGIGYLSLQPDGSPAEVKQLCSSGEQIGFELDEHQARWE
ncbi:alkaline phosphatase family protein [Motilimonas cestriensis]|uniref:Alkaline phosphatase family protein n=1 Tax=Motilimonas cestriensis TaxID=2742685 RepID=A0ABS8WCV4_9GAMM|nr:alkaline phosphatase D family protein [Motilimonas cestriensis]MCE2596872.1 alkaline phosphatase family protein [Motilimonas cestriensis]